MKKFKLGKKDPINKLSVTFGDFITVYPTFPIVDFAPDYVYPMDLNDQYGDCVVAGFDHSRQVITGLLGGTQKNFTTDEIETLYKTQNPNFPQDDNGMDIQLFLEYLVTNKYILGFAKIDHTNDSHMKAAMYLGLSIMTGVQLQQAQEIQFATGTWDFVPNSSIVGGHCINGVGYNIGIYDIVSWGKLISATSNFTTNQMDEAWFILMQEHVDHPGFRNHFDLTAFSKAISDLTGAKVVIPVTPPIPVPPILITNPTLRIGSKGPAVVSLQQKLNSFGSKLTADGVFGVKTQVAVVMFQSVYKLTADGIVGPLTWAALNGIVSQPKTLLDAMIQVESGGNDNAEGDLNIPDHAYGCLQIRQGVCDNVNARFGTTYKAQDCLGHRNVSVDIFNKYWLIHTEMITNQDKAFAWNGGPGWRSEYGVPSYQVYTSELNAYWARVQKELAS